MSDGFAGSRLAVRRSGCAAPSHRLQDTGLPDRRLADREPASPRARAREPRTREPRTRECDNAVMFSARVPPPLQRNAFSRALDAARAAGRDLIDLTISNPTRAGIAYPDPPVRTARQRRGRRLRAGALRPAHAREAVAADYARRRCQDQGPHRPHREHQRGLLGVVQAAVRARRRRVLVPAPSYPLFDHLSALDGVDARPTRCATTAAGGSISIASMLPVDAETRAVLAVSPNNPDRLGAVSDDETAWTRGSLCAARGAALILDEVFADYLSAIPQGRSPGATADDVPESHVAPSVPCGPGLHLPCLTFRLGGLSKSAALPQVKLGWIAVNGPAAARGRGTGAARAHLRHLPLGVDPGAGRRAGADCRRRRPSRTDARTRARATMRLCASCAPRARPSRS